MPTKKRKYEARFPPARIKKIMQTDEEIGKVAAAVPILICALEIFIQQLVEKASQHTRAKRAKTMTTAHVKHCIENESQFDFLKDLVANIADISNQEEEDANDSEGPKPKRQRKSRKQGEKRSKKQQEQKEHKQKSSSSSEESEEEDSAPSDNDEETTESPQKKPVRNTSQQPGTSSAVTDWNQRLEPGNMPSVMPQPSAMFTSAQDDEEEDYDS